MTNDDLIGARIVAFVVLILTLIFAAGPLLVPGFGGYDLTAFPVVQVDPPVQPAGWAFAIWGVIYLWLLVSAVYGLFKRATAPDWVDMRRPLAAALIIGALWLPIAQVSAVLATIMIIIMAIAAIKAFHDSPFLDRWYARAPIGLLAGWLTAASAVGLGVVLGGYGILSGETAAIAMILLALLVAGFVIWTVRDAATYGLGVSWALLGIVAANAGADVKVAVLAAIGMVLIGVPSIRNLKLGQNRA